MPSERRFIFLSGLPRSGSTLLANILFQNPRIHASGTSGLLDFLKTARMAWARNPSFRAMPQQEMKSARGRVFGAIPLAFYKNVERPLILDKSRGWVGNIPLIEAIFDHAPRILVCVRDVREIFASLERLRLKDLLEPSAMEMKHDFKEWASIDGRCRCWFEDDRIVGLPYRLIREALAQGHADKLHFVDYHQLTRNPRATLLEIYRFLGETPYPHDFQRVESRIVENDHVWRVAGLHDIRPVVTPTETQWQDYIPVEVGERYPGTEMWDTHLPVERANVSRPSCEGVI